jgi:hypothetical protein
MGGRSERKSLDWVPGLAWPGFFLFEQVNKGVLVAILEVGWIAVAP